MGADKRFMKSLEFLISATKGGFNRARIIQALLEKELNANQLSKQLSLDYKTVLHHLEKLRKDNIVVQKSEKYGGVYSLTFDETKKHCFEQIWSRIGQNNKNSKESE